MSRGAGPADEVSRDPSPGREGDGGKGDDEGARVRAVTARAIRRLDMLEYAILAAAACLAILAGALVAWLLASVTTWGFRTIWLVASVLLFVVPAAVAWRRDGGGGPPSSSGTRGE